MTRDLLDIDDLADPATVADFDEAFAVRGPVALVNLDSLEDLTPEDVARTRGGHYTFRRIPIGVRSKPLSLTYLGPGQLLLDRMATTLVPDEGGCTAHEAIAEGEGRHGHGAVTVRLPDPVAAAEAIRANAAANPGAALAFDTLLRIASASSRREGLIAESFAYAMLLAGADYRRWRKAPSENAPPAGAMPPATARREGSTLVVTLPGAGGDSGLDAAGHAHLVRLLRSVDADVDEVAVVGEGPDFWRTFRPDDVLTAEGIADTHLIRMAGSLAAAVYTAGRRMTAQVHGRCVGTGTELIALADHVRATPDAVFAVPNLNMGLVTGAGGTVSLTRRLGRWRAAYLLLSTADIDAATAHQWGLVDEIVE